MALEPQRVDHPSAAEPARGGEVIASSGQNRCDVNFDGIDLPCIEEGAEDASSPFDKQVVHTATAEFLE
jgi:hypothetical protein